MSHSGPTIYRTSEPTAQKKCRARSADEAPLASSPELATHEMLFHAIEGFIRSNSNFESSVPVNAAIDEIGKSMSLQEAFTIPLQRQLFNLDSALRWILFLTIAPERAEKEGDASFAPGSFSSQDSLTLISQVYDIGVQDAVWEHFEDEDEDEDDDDEDEEADEADGRS